MAEEPPKSEEKPADAGGGGGKSVFKSLSDGVRQLLLLDEKLTGLAKEDERFRGQITELQKIVGNVGGIIGEMDKRINERFAELDKRLAEIDRRTKAEIKLEIRDEMDRRRKTND